VRGASTGVPARETVVAQGRGAIPDGDLVGRDLRGADLTGLRLACGSLRGADLRGADLSNATLSFVDLSGARLDGATMAGAWFGFADFSGTSLHAVRAPRAHWQSSDLSGVDLTGADLTAVTFRTCTLERADLSESTMTSGQLVSCLCDEASFRQMDLAGTISAGSTFRGADFGGARRFHNNREMLIELLSRDIGEDFELARLVGAVGVGRQWCWDEWAGFLSANPKQLDLALEIFSRYPESGAARALRVAVQRAVRT
jgi:uncharacterized protein YjbI with pentapeptide repeats